jgi:hypothetical protein
MMCGICTHVCILSSLDYGYPLLVSLELEQSLQLQNKVYSIMKVYNPNTTTYTAFCTITNAVASNSSTADMSVHTMW